MSRNPHRVNWIGRDGKDAPKGRYCRACWEFAPTVRDQQQHADLFEPGITTNDDQETQ